MKIVLFPSVSALHFVTVELFPVLSDFHQDESYEVIIDTGNSGFHLPLGCDESRRVRDENLLKVFLLSCVTAIGDGRRRNGTRSAVDFLSAEPRILALRSAELRHDEEAENEKKEKEPVRSAATDTELRLSPVPSSYTRCSQIAA